jgi:uncharacterized protein YijF (DUF1287 family)
MEGLDSYFVVTFFQPGDPMLDMIPEEGVIDLRALRLNDRQSEALRLMVNEDKELSNAEYRRLFNVSQHTATLDFECHVPRLATVLASRRAQTEPITLGAHIVGGRLQLSAPLISPIHVQGDRILM